MSSIGPQLPVHLQQPTADIHDDDDDDDTPGPSVGPQIPAHLIAGPSKPILTPKPTDQDDDEESNEDDYGPALPPDLLAARSAPTAKRVVGPSFPAPQTHDRHRSGCDDDSDDDDDVGPMPLPAGISFAEEDGVREFMEREERRRKQIEVCEQRRNLNLTCNQSTCSWVCVRRRLRSLKR